MTAFFEKSYKNTRTIKTPDFDKKSGAFLTFLGIFWTLKLAWGSLWGSQQNPDF